MTAPARETVMLTEPEIEELEPFLYPIHPVTYEQVARLCAQAKLACRPAPAGEATVREGWVMVPVEPTEKMINAGYEAACGHDWPPDWYVGGTTPELYTAQTVYRAMLAAAPSPMGEESR